MDKILLFALINFIIIEMVWCEVRRDDKVRQHTREKHFKQTSVKTEFIFLEKWLRLASLAGMILAKQKSPKRSQVPTESNDVIGMVYFSTWKCVRSLFIFNIHFADAFERMPFCPSFYDFHSILISQFHLPIRPSIAFASHFWFGRLVFSLLELSFCFL